MLGTILKGNIRSSKNESQCNRLMTTPSYDTTNISHKYGTRKCEGVEKVNKILTN